MDAEALEKTLKSEFLNIVSDARIPVVVCFLEECLHGRKKEDTHNRRRIRRRQSREGSQPKVQTKPQSGDNSG